jgi:hypothetical protein
VTFFPKPKKVTKERFARRLAFLARGGQFVDELLFLGNSFQFCFVFATEAQWFACFSAGLLQQRAGGLRSKHKAMELNPPLV